MTVLVIVMMFALFILFYFPAKQEKYLIENYNKEIQILAETVALGVKIAIKEQNFEGIQTAIDFVKNDKRLQYVSLIQTDTVWSDDGLTYKMENTIFKTFPEDSNVDIEAQSNEFEIIKRAPFATPMMNSPVAFSAAVPE